MKNKIKSALLWLIEPKSVESDIDDTAQKFVENIQVAYTLPQQNHLIKSIVEKLYSQRISQATGLKEESEVILQTLQPLENMINSNREGVI